MEYLVIYIMMIVIGSNHGEIIDITHASENLQAENIVLTARISEIESTYWNVNE